MYPRSPVLDYRFVRLFRLLDEGGRMATDCTRGCAITNIYEMKNERFPTYMKYIAMETTREAYSSTIDTFRTFDKFPGCLHLSYLGKRLFETMVSVSLTGNVRDSLMSFYMGEVFVDIDAHPIKTIPVLVPEDVEKTYREVHGTSLRPQKVRSLSEVDVKAFMVSLPVKPHYIDSNNHVHYLFYALLFLEALMIACCQGHLLQPEYHPEHIKIRKLTILYENDVKLGDALNFWLWSEKIKTDVILCKAKRESDGMDVVSIECEIWSTKQNEFDCRL